MASTTIKHLSAIISANNTKFVSGLQEAKGALGGFQNVLKGVGPAIGVAFSAAAVINFGKEVVKLAGDAEGVRAAFQRIGDAKLLDDLTRATRSTVSELELMKAAVKANNFQIPLHTLAKLLEFATKRAQETGESVDYLVDSIVLGIGRKSPLILDNLGISAVRLRQELKGAGVEMNTVGDIAAAVGRIAQEEMAKSGDIIETTSIQISQLRKEFEDFKVKAGDKIISVIMTNVDALRMLGDENITLWQKIGAFLEDDEYTNSLIEWSKANRQAIIDQKDAAAAAQELTGEASAVANAFNEINQIRLAYEARMAVSMILDEWKKLDDDQLKNALENNTNAVGQYYEEWKKEAKAVRESADARQELINIMQDLQAEHLKEIKAFANARDNQSEFLKAVSGDALKMSSEQFNKLGKDVQDKILNFNLDDMWSEVFGSDAMAEFENETLPAAEEALDQLTQNYKDGVDKMKEITKDFHATVKRLFVDLALNMPQAIGSGLGELASGAKTLKEFFKDIARDILNNLGYIMITVGMTPPFLGTPAGAGLVVAGALLQGISAFIGGFNKPDVSGVAATAGGGTTIIMSDSYLYGNDIVTSYNHANSLNGRVG